MTDKKLIFAVLFSTYVITLECKLPLVGFGKKHDLRKFLNTHLPIWTYSTTIGNNEYCDVDITQQMSKKEISFSHSSYIMFHGKQKKFYTIMEGDIAKADTMYIHEKGRPTVEYEHIMYFFDESHKCAVIRVLPTSSFSGRSSIDLRVWNSSIHIGPSQKCVKYYKSVESHGHIIYKHHCQKIIANLNPTSQMQQQLHGKFLSTKDNIWTYSTSAMEHARCKVDHMKSISNKSIFFTRSSYDDKKRFVHCQGDNALYE
ncbi:uncharacterized protein [Dermacentor albipictus]|uniref:uncharacterized protein isoform X2 n=1 Tax=Dermacentor albipictus TaxID=60249 RepID=UPI0038FC8D70